MAVWCEQNLGHLDWARDAWSFRFRKEEDNLQFLLTWS